MEGAGRRCGGHRRSMVDGGRRSRMSRRAPAVVLSPADRAELARRVRARTSRQQDALRARIILLAAAGRSNTAIAHELDVARHTAQHWRTRFLAAGLAGLV